MLPIRFASFGLRRRLGVLLSLLLLGGAFVGSGHAAPLKGLGIDQFKELIDPKNDPKPSRKTAGAELAAFRRKVRQATTELPSLGEVARVLLLSEWNLIDVGSASPDLVKQAREAVRQEDDDSFQRAIQKVMAGASDSIDANRAVLAEIKHEARQKLLERLETRMRFYLRQGRTEDRIAVANLISDTMSKSRSQDRHEALTSLAMIQQGPTRRETRNLRERLAALADDLRALVADANDQVQVAGIRALSDVEIPPQEFVAAVKPKLTSKETPLAARRAAAEALGHVLSPVLEALANLLEESRPEPRVKTVEQILPVAALGLADDDALVRGSCLIACERSARILDELTRDQRMPPERGVVFQSAVQVVAEALPKINDAARDSVPALRVRACRVLETLALSSLRLRNLPTRPPSRFPEPRRPYSEPPKEEGRNNKGVSLPPSRRGRPALARPSQWATARTAQAAVTPLPPPPLAVEASTPAVTLDRPIQLAAIPVRSSESRVRSSESKPSGLSRRTPNAERRTEAVRPAAFVAPRMDELPEPTPVSGSWTLTVQAMIRRLSDPDYRVRLGAVDVLETLGDRAEAAVPALVKTLRDSNKFVRWAAARTLGRLAPRQADKVVPALVALLNDREDSGVREKAVLPALEEYGVHAKLAAPHLARVLNRGDKDYILAVLHTIQSIGTDAAVALPNVAWLLSDRTQPTSVRVEAANTLGRFGELGRKQPRVLSVLRDVMLNDPDAEVRNAASSAVLAIDRPLK